MPDAVSSSVTELVSCLAYKLWAEANVVIESVPRKEGVQTGCFQIVVACTLLWMWAKSLH